MFIISYVLSTESLKLQKQSGFAIRLRHSPWANFEVDWRNPKNPLSPKWRKGTGKSTGIPKYESTYTASAFRVYLYDFDVYIQLGNNDRY